MNRVQTGGEYEAQFNEILSKALDKTMFASVTAPVTPGDEFAVEHGLGFEPIGFLVISKDRACDVYLSATAATKDIIYLKATVADANLKIMVF